MRVWEAQLVKHGEQPVAIGETEAFSSRHKQEVVDVMLEKPNEQHFGEELCCRGKVLEDGRCRRQAKLHDYVEEELAVPLHALQGPVKRVDWNASVR